MKIVWLIEHVARELDVACAVKAYIESRYEDVEVEIKHLFRDLEEVIFTKNEPQLIAVPYFYWEKDFGLKELIRRFPDAEIFNLAWEEVFYEGHKSIKAPKGDFAFNEVTHHAWGDFFRNYLLDSGVKGENIFVNGNPSLQMNRPPYNGFYSSRKEMGDKFGLDISDTWVLVPDNYVWAFADNRLLKLKTLHGGDLTQMLQMKAYCARCLKEVLKWFNRLGERAGITVIYRPKPSVELVQFLNFATKEVEGGIDNIKVIRDLDVKAWIKASDMVFSSFSTTLMDAAIAHKPVMMLEPYEAPEFFKSEWQDLMNKVDSEETLINSVEHMSFGLNQKLMEWVESRMLSNGDPVKKLGDIIYHRALNRKSGDLAKKSGTTGWLYFFLIKERLKMVAGSRNIYIKDHFGEKELKKKVGNFKKLFSGEN